MTSAATGQREPQHARVRDGIALLLLLGCFAGATSDVPISPIFIGAALMLALLRYTDGIGAFPDYSRWCSLYYVYISGSMLLSGISAGVFLNYAFYRYDGNVYVSFLPFLIAPALVNHKVPIRVSLALLLYVASVFVLLWQVVSPDTLFRSHNALGGFISIMLMINLCLLRNPLLWLPLVFNVATLWLSDSRGSILGVVAAAILLGLYRRGWKKTAAAGALLAIAGSLALAGFGYVVWSSIGKPTILDIAYFSEGEQLAKGIDVGPASVSSVAKIGGRGATIAHRIFFIWPAAVDDFLASPLVGVGFSRFDDRPQDLEGVRGVLMVNRSPDVRHTNLHAHNSYLQVGSETGILGLLLVSGMLWSLWSGARKLRSPYGDIVRGIIFYILISSCTEQRLTTPAQMIPGASVMVFLLTSRFSRGYVSGADAESRE